MKKIIFIILLLVINHTVFCQSGFDKAIKLYYRVNPFDRRFSTVLTDILTDTSFVKKEMKKRTDSTLFFLNGNYKQFNPFDFKANETQLRMGETELVYNDSLNTNDTILIYQILGLVENNAAGLAKVKKEVTRFHKRFSYDFWRFEYKEIKEDNKITAGIYNYFFLGYQVAPLSIAWGKMPGDNSYTFIISLRLKIKENFGGIPKSPEEY